MVFWIVQKQHKLIGKINCGDWLNAAAHFHSSEASWESSLGVNSTLKLIQDDVRQSRQFLLMNSKPSNPLVYHKLSNIYQSLSVITITVAAKEGSKDGSIIKTRSVSASILPCFVPIPILILVGSVFFWVPFTDGGCNEGYLLQINDIFQRRKSTANTIINMTLVYRSSNISKLFGLQYIPSSMVFFLSFIALPVVFVAFLLLFDRSVVFV